MPGYGKQLDCELLKGKYSEARERAVALDAMHKGNGSPDGSNPSTGVHLLLDQICQAAKKSARDPAAIDRAL